MSDKKLKISVDDVESVKMLEGIFRKTLAFNKEVMICHFLLKKDITLPIHNHEASQAGFVLRGKIRFDIEINEKFENFIANKGDSYVFNSYQKHGAFILEEAEVIESFSPYREEYI